VTKEFDAVSERLAGLPDPLAFLTDVVAHAPFGILIYRADGHPLLSNQAFRDMFGDAPPPEYNFFADEMLGKLGMHDVLRRALAGEVVEAPLHWYDPREQTQVPVTKGRRRAVACTAFPIRSQGAIEHAALVFRDETDAQEALIALDRTHARLRRIIDTLPASVYAQDADGRFLLANRVTAQLLGREPSQVEGRTPFEITGEEEEPELAEIRRMILADRQGRIVPSVPAIIDGVPRRYELHKSVYEETPGGRLAVLTVALDVTERERAALLELRNQEMVQATRMKSDFLANMSHELRTPLNAIIGFAQLLQDGQVDPSTPQHLEFIGDILTSGQHLLAMVNDILDLSKVEAGKLDLHPQRCSIGTLLGEVAGVLRGASALRRITVGLEHDLTIDSVVLDPARFKQIVYNLLSNAIKFTDEGGRVIMRTRAQGGDRFELAIEDSGIGIRSEDVPRLFAEFVQLDGSTTKRHGGTGLGLALTKRLVEAQGGTIEVRSTFGKGSTFAVSLPVRRTVLAQAPRSFRPGTARVLVVEDDERERRWITGQLEDVGYGVVTAASVDEARRQLRKTRFDAVTLDVLLPDGTGIDVLREIRLGGHDIPVILVTVVGEARASFGDRVHDVLQKPIAAPDLLASLDRAGVRPGSRGGVLVIDDEPQNLRLMEALLSQLGYEAIVRDSAEGGLEALAELAPVAIVLDLVLPTLDGMDFVDELRKLPKHRQTPVLVWTVKDLSPEESRRLEPLTQGILPKGDSHKRSLLEELEQALSAHG
jgi:PAS domain S-box-containing protein